MKSKPTENSQQEKKEMSFVACAFFRPIVCILNCIIYTGRYCFT